MKRELASIQKILNITGIDGADKIELAHILGWQCVVKKGEFKTGDLCVYCEVDSVLPEGNPHFEFLRERCFRDNGAQKGFRIKTIRLRKQISQGIAFPLSILAPGEYKDGDPVTKILGVVKWDPPVPAALAGEVLGEFPSFIPKTDELRIQSAPETLDELKGKKVYISEKVDGTSATIYFNSGDFGVCSRNLELKETENNAYWKVAKRLDVANKLKTFGKNIAIQGELAGPGVQKNLLRLQDLEIFVFNIFFLDERRYCGFSELKELADKFGLKTVPVLSKDIEFSFTLDQLLEMAKGKYAGTSNDREGIVIRTMTETHSEAMKGRMSFKVLNNDFLAKEE